VGGAFPVLRIEAACSCVWAAAVFANLARKIAILAFCRAKLRDNCLLCPASKRSPRDGTH